MDEKMKMLDKLIGSEGIKIDVTIDISSEFSLFKEISKREYLEIDQRELEGMECFKSQKSAVSFESLILQLYGYSPIENYEFDIAKLKRWCNENNIHFYFDIAERLYTLSVK